MPKVSKDSTTQGDEYGNRLAADHTANWAEVRGKPRYKGIHLECA